MTRTALAAARRLHLGRPGAREAMLFGLALVVYQVSRAIVIGDASTAYRHAWDIVRLEDALGIRWESAIQDWALSVPGLVEGLNAFYITGHLPITAAFITWVYLRRRDAYRVVRDGFLIANGIAIAIFIAFPAAPPRLLEGAGLTDTLQAESGVDLHGGILSGLFNPYAAVPSMHFGYALLVGAGIALLARPRWARVAGAAYPALVLVTIIATGNHFVADAVAGALVMAAGVGMAHLPLRRRAGHGEPSPA